MKDQIRITQDMNQCFVTGVKDKAIVGYKYFDFDNIKQIQLEVRGDFNGTVAISHSEDGKAIGSRKVSINSNEWVTVDIPIQANTGKQALYFKFSGSGTMDFKRFTFIK